MIVVAGEALIDLVPVGGGLWRALPGGSPANTAVALARLSTRCALLARISDDPFGHQIRRHLRDNGVDLRYAVDAVEPTTLAVVDHDATGGVSYRFHLAGAADWQWTEAEIPAAFDAGVTAIHAGSMALIHPAGGAVIEWLLVREHRHRVIFLDPNVRPAACQDRARYRQSVERWLTVAHIVKTSADDVGWLYPGRAFDEVVADWAGRGPAVVVVTLGAAGALARTAAGVSIQVPAVEVEVVDAIGAGDAFNAGLLHALDTGGRLAIDALHDIRPSDLEHALTFAARVAALTCSRVGADPPHLSQLLLAD